MEKGFIFSLVLAGLVGIFALNNGDKVTIDLFLTEVVISQALVIFISTFLGAIIIWFFGWIKNFRYKKRIKELNNTILEKEKEIDNKNIEIANKEEDFTRLLDTISEKDEQIRKLREKELENTDKD